MFNEPPYAERHVRWCEGTGNQLMITFLLYQVISAIVGAELVVLAKPVAGRASFFAVAVK